MKNKLALKSFLEVQCEEDLIDRSFLNLILAFGVTKMKIKITVLAIFAMGIAVGILISRGGGRLSGGVSIAEAQVSGDELSA